MIGFARDGAVVSARFTSDEAAILVDLASQLVQLLSERGGDATGDLLFAQLGIGGSAAAPLDPALARLLPDAYRGDMEAASDHRRLTERALVERKMAHARAFASTLEHHEVSLDGSAVQSWLRTLTDLRLAIAARLQIEFDGDEGDDPATQALYDWLGYLQGTLIEVIDD